MTASPARIDETGLPRTDAWDGITVTLEHRTKPAGFPDRHVVLSGTGAPLLVRDAADPRRPPVRLADGDLCVIPAAHAGTMRWQGRATLLTISTAALQRLTRASHVDLVPARRTHDAALQGLIGLLLLESAAAAPAPASYVEALSTALAVHLVRRFGAPTGRPADRALERALAHVDTHLARPLRLADLARAAHLSPCHFARRFKAAVGVTPHEWVMRRRIERAQHLLRNGEGLPLAEVAGLVGFADQSHFTRQFRRRVGTTPRRFAGAAERYA